MRECDIGVYGLAVMGQNLVLNIADNDFKVAVYNRTGSKTEKFAEEKIGDKPVQATYELETFVGAIKKPRVILLIVKAGDAVDAVIDNLKPHLEADDIIIDGGNSHYVDTERRAAALAEAGIQYIGMGISGGEDGARFGPSLMPGGSGGAYERIRPIMEAVAADVDGEPCVAYLGERGAGHYVKMVHNGIEYGIMQAIAEVYDLLRRGAGMAPDEIGTVFQRWNNGILSSFLMEISWRILAYLDPETQQPLIDLIADRAKQKGTGKWTTQDALDLGVAVPTISQAVEARVISALKEEREKAAAILQGPTGDYAEEQDVLIHMLEQALLATMICCYAQGFTALRFASDAYDYDLNMAEIARIWRDGCIIRAAILDDMRAAFAQDNNLSSLMLADDFTQRLSASQSGWRGALQIAVRLGIPVPAMSSALAYYDSYRSERLPANMIQAQRDFFGAHTFERLDKDGNFHSEWGT